MAALPTGIVTFLLTDIEGSTPLWERHPNGMGRAVERHLVLIGKAVGTHGGHLLKERGEGDSTFCVFPDPCEALAAATDIQAAFRSEPWPTPEPLRIRIGILTGASELHEGDYLGRTVNRCARIRGLAHGGQTLVAASTVELATPRLPEGIRFRDLGSHRMRGLLRPERIHQLDAPGADEVFPPLGSLDAGIPQLPRQVSTFVGREQDLDAVRRLLLDGPLVTVTGPGGVGKTRLALEAAARYPELGKDGAAFAPLAALSEDAQVPEAIAQALGLRGYENDQLDLVASIGDRRLLLVIDNIEHLPGAVPLVADLLARCPDLRVLATSRTALHMDGEQTYPLPLLSFPGPSRSPDASAADTESLRLFRDRARATLSGFELDPSTIGPVSDICRHLEGLPLAIELAASRVAVLDLQALRARLGDALGLLTGAGADRPAHQRTLEATIAWSNDLLSSPGRRALRRLSVFAGGFSLSTAEAFLQDGSALDDVTGLLEHSLLQRQEGLEGGWRFRMLETIREFATARLRESGEEQDARRNHAELFARIASQHGGALAGPDREPALARLRIEEDNLRAAISWATESDPEIGLRMTADLSWFWYHVGRFDEGRRRLERALSAAPTADVGVRIRALTGAARLSRYLDDFARAQDLAEEAVRGAEDLGGPELAYALYVLALTMEPQGRREAIPTARRAVAVFRGLDDPWGLALGLFYLGAFSLILGDAEGARPALEEGRERFTALGDDWGVGGVLFYLGVDRLRRDEISEARGLIEQSAQAFRAAGDRWRLATALETLAGVVETQGENGTPLRNEALELRRVIGLS